VRLEELIEPLRPVGLTTPERLPPAQLDARIIGVAFDSRAVRPGSVFVARSGTKLDGHAFIAEAAEAGSAAIVGSAPLRPEVEALLRTRAIAYLRVADPAEALSQLAAQLNGRPSSALSVVGVTGTNGKTTVATLLHQLFTALGHRSGLIGTTGIRIVNRLLPNSHTTPDPVELQRLLAEMVRAGCRYCFIEVTSHAIDQRRIAGVDFAGGIFTTLGHDHLDYHGTLEAYARVKQRFFADLPANAFALTNTDDPRGRFMVATTQARVGVYGSGPEALLPWSVERCDEHGMQVRLGPHRVQPARRAQRGQPRRRRHRRDAARRGPRARPHGRAGAARRPRQDATRPRRSGARASRLRPHARGGAARPCGRPAPPPRRQAGRRRRLRR